MPDRQTLRRWSRVALSSPPRQTAMIGARKLRGWYAGLLERQRSGSRPSYDLARTTGAQLARFVEPPRHEMLASRREQLTALADLYLDHRFDLLGSGWVRVQHGMSATGVDGIRYARSPSIAHEDDRKSVMGLLNHANRAEATRIHALISRAYQAIDWQLDFKSGFRWSEATWFREIRYGAARGADVKVPWELGRCQHLPQLALAAVLASEDGDAERVDRLRQEFRDQVLDVVSANPPRFGVQWVSTMDVAIRVANWLLAWGPPPLDRGRIRPGLQRRVRAERGRTWPAHRHEPGVVCQPAGQPLLGRYRRAALRCRISALISPGGRVAALQRKGAAQRGEVPVPRRRRQLRGFHLLPPTFG